MKTKLVTIYFDRGRRMIEVPLAEVAETIERLLEQKYTVFAAFSAVSRLQA